MAILAFEIGGTTIRSALIAAGSLELLAEARRPTPNFHDPALGDTEAIVAALSDEIARLGRELDPTGRADAVAVGYPGPVSPDGLALSSPTLLGREHDRIFDVADLTRQATGIAHVIVMNDVSACGYRYVSEGARNFCLINVGSGIGNKIFLDGMPVVGPMGRGGELGHFTMMMEEDAPLCECGGRGHLAGISSGRGTLAWVEAARRKDPEGFATSALSSIAAGRPLDNRDIVTAFRAGDRWTAERVARAAKPLAHAVAGLHVATGIESFIVVGGFAEALGSQYIDLLKSQCRSACWAVGQDWNKMITAGRTGDHDGLIGLAHAVARAPADR